MIYTTLNKIREHSPCSSGWAKLLKSLGKTQADDEPLSLLHILQFNGLDDALWCCCTLPEYAREWRLYAVWCARKVQHLMSDPRSVNALDVAERYACGIATDAELEEARAAAWAAAWAAARAATRAATEAARAAAWAAAREAAWAATEAARAATWDEARSKQEAEFIRIITENGTGAKT